MMPSYLSNIIEWLSTSSFEGHLRACTGPGALDLIFSWPTLFVSSQGTLSPN